MKLHIQLKLLTGSPSPYGYRRAHTGLGIFSEIVFIFSYISIQSWHLGLFSYCQQQVGRSQTNGIKFCQIYHLNRHFRSHFPLVWTVAKYAFIFKTCFYFQNVLSFSKCAFIFKMCFHFQNVRSFLEYALIFEMCFHFWNVLSFSKWAFSFKCAFIFSFGICFLEHGVTLNTECAAKVHSCQNIIKSL